jgi:uncharacterized protein YbjT (DUF2867 family)
MLVVAGATGRVGGAAAATLLAAGAKVRVLVRDSGRGAPWAAHGAELAVASLDDEAALARAFAGTAGIHVLLPEDPADTDFHARRRRMAENIARAARAARVPRIVFLSTVGAFLAEGNGPAADLHYAEDLLAATGAALCVVRAAYLQENVLAGLPAARSDGTFANFLPSADIPFPTVAAVDVGRFAARALLGSVTGSETIDLLGPQYTVREMADALGRAIGRSLRVVDVPPRNHIDAFLRFGASRAYAEAMAEMFACVAAGRIAPHGDRSVFVTTPLAETLATRLAA